MMNIVMYLLILGGALLCLLMTADLLATLRYKRCPQCGAIDV